MLCSFLPELYSKVKFYRKSLLAQDNNSYLPLPANSLTAKFTVDKRFSNIVSETKYLVRDSKMKSRYNTIIPVDTNPY